MKKFKINEDMLEDMMETAPKENNKTEKTAAQDVVNINDAAKQRQAVKQTQEKKTEIAAPVSHVQAPAPAEIVTPINIDDLFETKIHQKKIPQTFTLDPAVLDKIESIARNKGISQSQVLNTILKSVFNI